MDKKLPFACAAWMLVALMLPFRALAKNLPQVEDAQMQQNIRTAEAACGDPAVRFNVKRIKGPSDVPAPSAGFARLVVLEQGFGWYGDEYFVPKGKSRPKHYNKLPQRLTPTVRVGMDGQWMGALRGNDFITFTVPPGEHHLCVQFQNPENADTSSTLPMAFLSGMRADAGRTYYFQISYMMIHNLDKWGLELQPLQEYSGRLILSRSSPVAFERVPNEDSVTKKP
jgi:hypothetical protein